MITRIVRLSIRPDSTEKFLSIFSSNFDAIRLFDGCQQLSLYSDTHQPCLFTTISLWDSEASLEEYRKSGLFAGIWPQVKELFDAPTVAFTLKQEYPVTL